VRPGDTLWDISRRYGVKLEALIKLNSIGDPRRLQPGAILTLPSREESPSAPAEAVPVSRGSRPNRLLWPLLGPITSGFGWRGAEFHHGLDIAARIGEEIRAAWPGVVTFSGWYNAIYGRMVKIDHGQGLETVYVHTSRNLVREGEKVEAGQPIAEVGCTGRATGPHLHFEVREEGVPVNPLNYLR